MRRAAAKGKQPANGIEGAVEVPVDAIRTALTGQHRREFDQAKLEELAASIRKQGILQPLLLRDMGQKWEPWQHDHGSGKNGGLRWDVRTDGDPEGHGQDWHVIHSGKATKEEAEAECRELEKLVIVAGERRWRASQLAGLTHVPAIVRKMSDAEAGLAQLTENVQREDLNPMEEAAAYDRLIREKVATTVGELAARAGKPDEYVRARLRLRDLLSKGQELLLEGKLPLQHALEIAKLQPESQEAALRQAFEGFDRPDYNRPRRYSEFMSYLARHVMLNLSSAPWRMDAQVDGYRVPGRQTNDCATCRFNTATDQSLFGDEKGSGRCTAPKQFAAKVEAFTKQRLKELRREKDAKVFPVLDRYYVHPTVKKKWGNDTLGSEGYNLVEKGAEECPHTAWGVFVDGNDAGHARRVCTDKSCKTHSRLQSRGTSSKPKGEKTEEERQKFRERKQEIFVAKSTEEARPTNLRRAIEKLRGNHLSREDRNQVAFSHYLRIEGYTRTIIKEVWKALTGEDLPAHIATWDSASVEKVGKFVETMSDERLAQFELLCATAHFGENQGKSYHVRQTAATQLFEKKGVNWREAVAARMLENAAKKYKPRFEEHLEKIKGGATPGFWPTVYDTGEDVRPKSAAASAGKSSATNSAKSGRGPKQSKASSSGGRAKKGAGRSKPASTSKSTSPSGGKGSTAKPTRVKSSRGARSTASSGKGGKTSKRSKPAATTATK